ncbi:MAG: hypothetical protein GYB53_10355 [Rhodobacteraceae bacterium]|uniref:hypothetical protein n=1 Tax=Oceanicola sp. S124 TaxID=1042378 RepID=UPI000255797C|nr:hypothetical protein [Oceanicola sp. S124]MBR9763902.1 hypothetical protein [Paracoccaceae bacterium]MBR9820283.1 hypothetical protein [Paracoccaceae bacterium]
MFKKSWILAGVLLTGLAACGDTLGEQAVVGGAAGVGAAAVTGGSVGTGALVGAAGNVAYCQANPGACR